MRDPRSAIQAGSANAGRAGNPAAALVHWRKLMAQLPANSRMRPRLAADIAKAEKALADKK